MSHHEENLSFLHWAWVSLAGAADPWPRDETMARAQAPVSGAGYAFPGAIIKSVRNLHTFRREASDCELGQAGVQSGRANTAIQRAGCWDREAAPA